MTSSKTDTYIAATLMNWTLKDQKTSFGDDTYQVWVDMENKFKATEGGFAPSLNLIDAWTVATRLADFGTFHIECIHDQGKIWETRMRFQNEQLKVRHPDICKAIVKLAVKFQQQKV